MSEYLKEAAELIKGSIDPHMHTAPDIFKRSVTDVQAAYQAKSAGMKAILIKCHVTSTADRAKIASEVTGFPVYGGVALNYALGGLNYHAVESAAQMGAKIVWMPTFNAAQYLKHVNSVPMFAKVLPKDMVGLSLFDENGDLVKEIDQIIDVVLKYNMILATGHISAEEGKKVIAYAQKAGVKKIILTHATADFLDYTMEDIIDLAKKGVFIEHNWVYATPQSHKPFHPKKFADDIKQIGARYCILGTDGGQAINKPPVEMYKDFIASLLEYGISKKDIELMIKDNISYLLEI